MATLKNRNLELQARGFDIERLDREVAVAKRNYYPDIGVGVQWMRMPMPEGGSENDVMLGLELNLPIWRSSYRAGELQARAMARRARYERKDLENSLAARIEQALYEFENSGRQVRLYDDALVPRAQELIGASEAAYMAGTIDFLNLISAQQDTAAIPTGARAVPGPTSSRSWPNWRCWSERVCRKSWAARNHRGRCRPNPQCGRSENRSAATAPSAVVLLHEH